MKAKFSTFDLLCSVADLQRLVGMRVNQIYDIDSKTYLIRVQQGEHKELLLLESGTRIHTTSYEWPKNVAPSGFSMKLRKHIKNKRLEKLNMIGLDRIVDLQFGTGEVAYHVILELYDRGNIILTDFTYKILNILRPHTEHDTIKFVVNETYPLDRGKERPPPPSEESVKEYLRQAKQDEGLKRTLNYRFVYGPALLEHVLLKTGLTPFHKIKDLNMDTEISKIMEAYSLAEKIVDDALINRNKGFIIQKREKKGKDEEFLTNQEFNPMIFEQNLSQPYIEFESFDKAVDEFFSNMESQKIDLKGVQQELAALKKLETVKKSHQKQILALEQSQVEDTKKAELIARNQELVDDAINAIRQAIAKQMSWADIKNLVKEATNCGDSVASVIKELKLQINHITLLLQDPYEEYDGTGEVLFKSSLVDIDLDLSAYANAKKYYDKKRQAATKQKKTIESQDKAFKSVEKKTKQTLKEVKTNVSISKARKVYWFEKFFWFISSENYLVIGGRDQQQNEVIVKRHLKKNDIYVHAGIIGASSVVIKNANSDPIPPKTLNEAGTMAICYSTAWDAKVVTSAWWVYANQVSKTAPTGEYLTTGSFMIRGKKNFLPQSHLIMGFAFLFKLEDGSVERHLNERKKKEKEDLVSEKEDQEAEAEQELELEDGSSDDEKEDTEKPSVLEESSYPDTEVIVKHKAVVSQCSIEVKLPHSEKVKTENEKAKNPHDEEYVVYLGDDKPIVIKPSKGAKKSEKKVSFSQQTSVEETQEDKNAQKQQQQSKQKRGQKSKLKKIKEKYKDQDEEEREMRMRILQGVPSEKDDKKKKKKKKGGSIGVVAKKESQSKKVPMQVQLLSTEEDVQKSYPVENEDEEDEDKDEMAASVDISMLDSLTGQPLPEDELLFAMPVVAPYNAVTNYKYKVKLTPGTGKRGKAAKTVLNVLLKDKTGTQREKDLLKFIKDQDLARNFPGKVKISAPQLMKYK